MVTVVTDYQRSGMLSFLDNTDLFCALWPSIFQRQITIKRG